MKMRKNVLALLVLLSLFPIVQARAFERETKRIRGRIVARVLDFQLLVRTSEKEYVLLNIPSPATNPLPARIWEEKRIWEFAVRPARECTTSFAFFRFQEMEIKCGTEPFLEKEPEPQPVAPPPRNSYPQLSLIEPKYGKELDGVADAFVPRCFDLDLSLSKPRFAEKRVEGVVVFPDGQPAPEMEVSVGFSGSKSESYVTLTDTNGRFSFSIYDNFAYWVKLRYYSIDEDDAPISIPPKKKSAPLRLVVHKVLN